MKNVLLIIALMLGIVNATAQGLKHCEPAEVGLDASRLLYADSAINKAIAEKATPGAVLCVVRHGKIAYLKAYGNKRVYPRVEKMTTGTVFDMASCSKAMSTAVSAWILIEQGKLRLLDRVDKYIPGFENWKDSTTGEVASIRVVDLMSHVSGLPPYADVNKMKEKYGAPNRDGLIDYICHCKRDFAPTTDFQYSCLNFITLQRIIETISGESLNVFAKRHIFDVLGMSHTDYTPSPALAKLCAPTEKQANGKCLQGVVHDPLARVINGGISGNAGVFSTAEDIAVLCAALQNGGSWNGHRILSPLAVKAMRTVHKRAAKFGRTPGWDCCSDYASNNGDMLSAETYGHTGFTGTSIVIDPVNDISVILLANAVHPDGKGNVIGLRSYVANAVASSIMK